MKTSFVFYFTFFLLFSACGQNNKSLSKHNFDKYKKDFDSFLIDNFPSEIESDSFSISSSNSLNRNDIGLTLIEYNLDSIKLYSIRNKADRNAIAHYGWGDSCLLIINRFETIESIENLIVPTITDSSLLNKDCYQSLYPIPNFIDNTQADTNANLKLDSTFLIYVLDAHSGTKFKKYNLLPNFQMPKKWANGYSKGLAISVERRIVIYWAIIW